MNVNNKNRQIERCPCPKYGMVYRPDIYNLQVKKKTSEKWARVKIHLSNNATNK